MTKKVYSYDQDGYYNGEVIAHESPLEKDVYLMPANSTEEEPPIFHEKKLRKWTGEQWIEEEKSEKTQSAEEELATVKQIKISDLEQYFRSDEIIKISVNLNNFEHRISNNSEIRNLFLTKMVVMQNQIESGLTVESDVTFSFKNGSEVIDMTMSQIKQTLFILDQKRRSQFYNKEAHKISILSLTNKESVESYNFKTGW